VGPHLYLHQMQPTPHAAAAGVFAGVAPLHAPALLVPLILPIAIGSGLGLLRRLTRWRAVAMYLAGHDCTSSLTRVTAVLLLLAGGIHLALVAPHLAIDPLLAVLFGMDGLALVLVAGAAGVWSGWRPAAAPLLVLTLAAYLASLATGAESPDAVGTAAYLIELITLGLVWVPRPSTRSPPPAEPAHTGVIQVAGAAPSS